MPDKTIDQNIKILLIEDDASIRKSLNLALTANSFEIIPVATAQEAILAMQSMTINLVLLDLGLPDCDGQILLREIVKIKPNVPVIIISARIDEMQKVHAFDGGAVDYLVKPFGVAELIARIRNALRFVNNNLSEKSIIKVGDLTIDFTKHQVMLRGEIIKLTPKEFKLLKVLAENPGKMLTHQALMEKVWGPAHIHDNTYLRIYIGQLRRKIELKTNDYFIENEAGIGYRLRYH